MAGERITDLALADTPLDGSELLEVSQLSLTVEITAATISAQASDNSYNDSANGFIAAGFAVGQRVNAVGFTGNVVNNITVGTITALTAGKMTIGGADGDVIVDDAAGESVTIRKWDSRRVAVDDLPGGGGSALEIEDEGVSVDAAVAKINFVGAGVTATQTAPGEVEVGIPGGGGGGGSALVTPSVVQQATIIGNAASVTFGAALTPGNLLVALLTHYNNVVVASGWVQVQNSVGASTDGNAIFVKRVRPGDSTAQSPCTGVTAGCNLIIYEVEGAGPLDFSAFNQFQEYVGTTNSLPLGVGSDASLILGMFASVSADIAPSSVTGATAGTTVTGTSTSASPRQLTPFSVESDVGGVTPTVTYASGTTRHNGLALVIPPRVEEGSVPGTSGLEAPMVTPEVADFAVSRFGTGGAANDFPLGVSLEATISATNTNSLTYLANAIPAPGASGWKATGRFRRHTPWSLGLSMGMMLRDSVGGRSKLFWVGQDPIFGILTNQFTDDTTWNNVIGLAPDWFANDFWMQIEDNLTNRILRISMDGYNWQRLLSESNTSWVTPNQVGFFLNPNGFDAPANQQGQAARFSCLSWDVVTLP